jgi:hypothetical protein
VETDWRTGQWKKLNTDTSPARETDMGAAASIEAFPGASMVIAATQSVMY